MLQSKAGYIDARPHIRQLDEILLQRTAGPYIRVIFVRSNALDALGMSASPAIASELWNRSESAWCAGMRRATTAGYGYSSLRSNFLSGFQICKPCASIT
jgi:hypothetical protein